MSSTAVDFEDKPEKELLSDMSQEKDDWANTTLEGEYIDSPERDCVSGDENEEKVKGGQNVEISHSNHTQAAIEGKQFNSTMEGELDFEDEVGCRLKVEEGDEVLVHTKKHTKDSASNSEKEISEEKCSEEEKLEDKETPPSDDDEGQLSPEKPLKDESIEEGEDEGEISDDDDLEEGEVKDNSPAMKQPTRQVCRFFNRGQCTWGTLCRFLHLSVNEKGHYNMFAPTLRHPPGYGPLSNAISMGGGPAPNIPGPVAYIMNPRSGPRGGQDFLPPLPPPMPPPPSIETAPETAWERGLRHAKELMKKASRRKEQEPNFEEKRLNLSIDENDRAPSEYNDKENEFHGGNKRRQNDIQPYKYEEANEVFDSADREAREHWKRGRYENFEIRMHGKERREKDRSRSSRMSSEREKIPKQAKGERWQEERLFEIQTRPRADEWRDPWRRSKSPKGRRSRSRGRSRGSYSSVSSYSYSDRSSRSSYSYSRSSSRSSFYSSRSPSPNRTQKRKPTPQKEVIAPPKAPIRVAALKRKAPARNSRSRSYSRSRSSRSFSRSRSSSSRSRSITRTPSVSRSRSYSRSLSMDSVSSASSSVSHSSSGSGSLGNRNPHMSILRKEEEKPQPTALMTEPKASSSSLFEEMQRLREEREYEKTKEVNQIDSPDKEPSVVEAPLLEKKVETIQPYTSLQYLLPASDKVLRDPVKYNIHKQQIKLTLLNKAISTKLASLPKKEFDNSKTKLPEKDEPMKTIPLVPAGIKRPSSPLFGGLKSVIPLLPKRSTSSRRDELLKQLKAVEDAIARKRAKFS